MIDTLAQELDVASFELLAYSHQPQVQLIGNVLRFNFPNINLPDSNSNEPGSHGYVQYSIKLKDSLPLGTSIGNTAYIYFDFNPPVVTNTTSNIISSIGFDEQANLHAIKVYPNPTYDYVTIVTETKSLNCNAIVYNMLGKELFSQKINGQNTTINLKGLSQGNYLLKLFDGNNLIGVARVVKM